MHVDMFQRPEHWQTLADSGESIGGMTHDVLMASFCS